MSLIGPFFTLAGKIIRFSTNCFTNHHIVTHSLASWFSCQEISWIFEISCQDLGNNSWQCSQHSARYFKIVDRNPREFLDKLSKKPRISKILGFLSTILKYLAKCCEHCQEHSRQENQEAKQWVTIWCLVKQLVLNLMILPASVKNGPMRLIERISGLNYVRILASIPKRYCMQSLTLRWPTKLHIVAMLLCINA